MKVGGLVTVANTEEPNNFISSITDTYLCHLCGVYDKTDFVTFNELEDSS